jgi:DNA polymerase-3 subunit delta'
VARRPASKPATKVKSPREVEVKPPRRAEAPAAPKPLSLSAIIGQDQAIAGLRAAIQSQRIHHAWIFHGPPGVGKFAAALSFAAVILDPSSAPGLSGEIEPDPESPTQQLLAAGTHPDLHIVTKELAAVSRDKPTRDGKQKNIAREVLEEFLLEPAGRTRVAAGGAMAAKVFIVDEAELIDRTGQNALLKTLEEPPAGSVIILVTASEDRLLPTIRSRCQPAAFGPLSAADMAKWVKKSKLPLDDLDAASRDWLLAYAGGSPGQFSLAVNTGIVGWHTALAPLLAEVDRGRFPLDLGSTMSKLVDEWATAWVDGPGGANASKDAANKAAARQMFRLLAEHYRARLRAAAERGQGADAALAALDAVMEAERQAESAVQGLFVMDNLAAQLAQLQA